MSRPQKEPLRALSPQERVELEAFIRSWNEPVAHVARARALLALAAGASFTEAAKAAGRRSGDGVAKPAARFNALGLAAIARRPHRGRAPTCDEAARARILAEARRAPEPGRDGTATWSLSTLRRAPRRAPDGLPKVSTYTIGTVLTQAGCATGALARGARQARSGASAKPVWWKSATRGGREKKLVEDAYAGAAKLGLALWTEDEAGPYQTLPYPGESWCGGSQPPCQPHEYVRNGAAKSLSG